MSKEHIDTTLSTVKIDGTEIDGITPGSLPFPKPSRDTKDVTTIKDLVRKKGLKILDPGTASFAGIAIPGDAGQILLLAASDDMQEHTIQITVPEASLVFEYQGYISTYYPSEEDENTLYFNTDIEVTGGFVRSAVYAGITSIEGAGAGVAYYPATANTAFDASGNGIVQDIIIYEANGVTTDTIEVTAADADYIGISYNNGSTYTEMTSGTALAIPVASYPAAGALKKAVLRVAQDTKASRFVNIFITHA